MVRVNGQDITFYPLDSLETFFRRVATKLNTLPKYLHPDEGISLASLRDEDATIEILDLVDIAKKSDQDFEDFWARTHPNKKSLFPLVSSDEFIKIFITYNPDIEIQVKEGGMGEGLAGILLDFLKNEILPRLDVTPGFDLYKFWKSERKTFKEDLKKKITDLKETDKKWSAISRTFIDTPYTMTTSFLYEQVLVWYESNFSKVLPAQIFNDFTPTDDVPFASFNNIYKLQETYNAIPPTWQASHPTLVNMKVVKNTPPTGLEKSNIDDLFSNVFFSYNEESNIIMIGIQTVFEKTEIDTADIILKISNCLTKYSDIQIELSEFEKVSGLTFAPRYNFDKFIFADEVMNNDIFSYYLSVDESQRASTNKASVFAKFFDPVKPELGRVALSFTGKIAERNDPDLRYVNRAEFPLGTHYLKLRVLRADSKEAADNAVLTIRKLLTIMDKDTPNIISFYQRYLPDFGKEEEVVEEEVEQKYLAPEIFVANYTRACPKKPRIVSNEEANALKKEGFQVIKFPKTEAEGNQYWFACDHHGEYKYPGLRVNKLENKDKYPAIPCCYNKDHSKKPNSLFKIYYLGEEAQVTTIQQKILTTNKFVGFNKFGYLPRNLENILEMFDYTYSYLRKGVTPGKSTFLECVLENVKDDFLDLSEEEREYTVALERLNLSQEIIPEGLQSLYGYTNEQIRKDLQDVTVYLDPKKFLLYFQEYYKINIFLLTRDENASEGDVSTPDYKWILYSEGAKWDRSIIIYEHYGNESDNAKYPHCELVVKWTKGTEDVIYNFEKDDPLSKGMTKLTKTRSSFYIDAFPANLNPRIDFGKTKGQYVDDWGHTRGLLVEFNGIDIGFVTPPLPIMDLPIIPKEQVEMINRRKTALSFIETKGMSIVHQVRGPNYLEIAFSSSVYMFIMKISSNTAFEDVPEGIPYFGTDFSILDDFYEKRRVSNYLIEITKYQYSRFLSEREIPPTMTSLEAFSVSIGIDPSVNYQSIVSPLLEDNNSVHREEGIYVDSEETKSAVLYNVLIFQRRKANLLLAYKDKIFVEDYFKDLGDYKKVPNTLIFTSKDVFSRGKNNTNLYRKLQPISSPYYLSLSSVKNGALHLAIPTTSKDIALYITNSYLETGMIPDIVDKEYVHRSGYNVYLYESVNSIKRVRFAGGNTEDPFILVYKKNGVLHYQALLKVLN